MKKIGLILPIKTSLISLPRFYAESGLNDYELQPLKNSISQNGILFPLTVRETEKGRYEAVCGKRRLLCAKALGIKTVPCIKIAADCTEAKFLSLCETLSIKEPDCFDLADRLYDLTVNSCLDADTLRYRLGITENYLTSKLNLLKLSDNAKQRIKAAGITEKQATLLLNLNPEHRAAALDYIIANALNERETAEYITSVLNPKKEPPKPIRKAAISDLKLFSNSLSKMLTTLSFAGYDPNLSTNETDTEISYIIRLSKKCESPEYFQIPLC